MRCRLVFRKDNAAIYTSALDLQKIWERSLKRAHLKVKYSEGFHPQPKIQLALPLPLGFSGDAEIIDIVFCEPHRLDEILTGLKLALPEGIEAISIEEIPENEKALNSLSESAEFLITINRDDYSKYEMEKLVRNLLDKEEISRVRNRKAYDLRPLIVSAEVRDGVNNKHLLYLHLLAQPGATGRPDEVLTEMGIDPALCVIKRIQIHFKQ